MVVPLRDLRGEILCHKGAKALCFTCPLCQDGHVIIVSWGKPLLPGWPIWRAKGDSIDNITIEPAIDHTLEWRDRLGKLRGSTCGFKGFVVNGNVTWQFPARPIQQIK